MRWLSSTFTNFFLELSRGEQRVSTPENGIKFENYTFIIIIFFLLENDNS